MLPMSPRDSDCEGRDPHLDLSEFRTPTSRPQALKVVSYSTVVSACCLAAGVPCPSTAHQSKRAHGTRSLKMLTQKGVGFGVWGFGFRI